METAGPASRAGVIRITTFDARSGRLEQLTAAAQRNARDARQASGCLSAEVCVGADQPPATVVVVSRWGSAPALDDFLARHEHQAHDTVSPYTAAVPHSVHYRVAADEPGDPATSPG